MFFHTTIGSTLVAIISATYGRGICEGVIKIWNAEIKGNIESNWLTYDSHISKTSAWIGALIGEWSHLMLDSFMYFDIIPLSPFTDANLLLGTINLSWLHGICLGLGLIGLLCLRMKST